MASSTPSYFNSTPTGRGLLSVPADQRRTYILAIQNMPQTLFKTINSNTSAAFLQGIAKQFKMTSNQTLRLALAVLRIAVGEVSLAKFGAALSSELQLPNDKAQAIAKEIEKELFAPVMLELNQFLEERKKENENSGGKAKQAGATNVVDLKNDKS